MIHQGFEDPTKYGVYPEETTEAFNKGMESTGKSVRKSLPKNNGFAPGLRSGEHGTDDRSELREGK
jgi:hypothetical protein